MSSPLRYVYAESTTLPTQWPWYSLQDATEDAKIWVDYPQPNESQRYLGVHGDVNLWDGGCRVGPNEWNCTAACVDPARAPALLWNSTNATLTFHNCLIYPFLASSAQTGLFQENATVLQKYNIPK